MSHDLTPADVTEASRLVVYGLEPKKRPASDQEYAELVDRYLSDVGFQTVVRAVCRGMDLEVLGITRTSGIVLVGAHESLFATKMSDYTSRVMTSNEGAHLRVLHGLTYLGIAALAYPRPADLSDPGHVGRITPAGVDDFVRQACRRLEEKANAEGQATDPLVDAPDLEAAWRVYQRRSSDASTKDGRTHQNTTTGIARRALKYLVDNGLLTVTPENVYKTTARFQLHVQEAGARMFDDLTRLGIAHVTDGDGTLITFEHHPHPGSLL